MTTNVSIQTVDGRIINGMNYTVNATNIPRDPNDLAATMPGGLAMGVYHLRTMYGWEYIPASNIAGVLSVKPNVAL